MKGVDADAIHSFYLHHRTRRRPTPLPSEDQPIDMVVFDMDGVLIDVGSSWVMVHRHFGVDNMDGLHRYLRGELDDLAFIATDLERWKSAKEPVTWSDLEEALRVPPLMEGVRETVDRLHKEGIRTAIVSGGIDIMAQAVAKELDIPIVYANGFETNEDGHLTDGVLRTPLHDKAAPILKIAKDTGIGLSNMLSIGNSVPDVSMFEVTGRSIAFRPDDDYTRDHATWTIEDGPLTKILDILF